MAITGLTIVTDALLTLNVFGAGDPLPADDAAFVLGVMNATIDLWNADGVSSYGENFDRYTLVPNLSPHTIGPTGTFVIGQRPEAIDGANVILGSGASAVRYGLDLIDDAADFAIPLPGMTSTLPRYLNYARDVPNGQIFLWPVPTAANTLELMTRTLLASLLLTSVFQLPAGYQRALTLTVAEEIATAYEKQVPVQVQRTAARARATLWAANAVSPGITTRAGGMPGDDGGWFNYRTGLVE